MALINPSNLYSEGQVNLDSTPYLRMQQQQQAKKQAREDALYKYFSELPTKINSAGMRVQDIDGAGGGFNKKLENIRSFWDANKQDIIRGGRAQQAYQQLVQDATQYADQSKKTAQFQLKFGQDYFQGKHKPRQRDLQVIASIDRPIDDPTHYKDSDIKMPYGYNDLSIAAPDFDANRQSAFDRSLLGKTEPQILEGEKPRYDTNTYEVIYNKKYRPEDIYAVAQKAAGDIKSDLSAYNHFEDALEDIDQVKIASDALSKLSGTPVIAETPEQMAAGLKAAQLMNFSKEDRRKDVAAVNKFKLNMADKAQRNKLKNMGIQDAYIRGRMRMRDNLNKNFLKFKQAASREEEEGIVTKIINDQFENSPYKYEGAVVEGKQFGKGRFVQPTVNIVDKYTIDKGYVTEKKPDMFYMTEDKKYVIPAKIKYKEDGVTPEKNANGSIKWNTDGFRPIPIQNYRAEIAKELISKKNQGAETIDEFLGENENGGFELTMSNLERTPSATPSAPQKKETKKVKINW